MKLEQMPHNQTRVLMTDTEGFDITAGFIRPSRKPGLILASYYDAAGDQKRTPQLWFDAGDPETAARAIIAAHQKSKDDADEIQLYAINTAELYEYRLSIIRRSIRDPLAAGSEVNEARTVKRYAEWLRSAAARYQWEVCPYRFTRAAILAAAKDVYQQDLTETKLGNYATI